MYVILEENKIRILSLFWYWKKILKISFKSAKKKENLRKWKTRKNAVFF